MDNQDAALGDHRNGNEAPSADAARQAVHALRGYAYQAMTTALAWIDLDDRAKLFIEVAEDYAELANNVLHAVQIKDARDSGTVTLNTASVRETIAAFIDLVGRNKEVQVDLRFFTTSEIGQELRRTDRPGGMPGLQYWRRVAATPDVPVSPLRKTLESKRFSPSVRAYCRARNDAELRRDLIERIAWDCGKPDIDALRQELEERLIVVGRDVFGVPAPEARRLAATLMYRVLKTSTAPTAAERVLTRPGLYELVDAATRVAVPRRSLELGKQFDTALMGGLRTLAGASEANTVVEVGWLIPGPSLPATPGLLRRTTAEAAVSEALKKCGVTIVVGGTGLGKTMLCQSVATTRGGSSFVVEFRDTSPEEARRRLNLLLGHLGELARAPVVLDDIDHLDNPRVVVAFGRVIASVRRRGVQLMATCHVAPAVTTLARLDLASECVVKCDYFSEADVNELVQQHGGAAKQWGRIAYLSSGGGHPQLAHGFVIGMAAGGWPDAAIREVVGQGLRSKDVAATQDSARRGLIAALPWDARVLLYRLSLAVGPFDRALALSIATVAPPVRRAGEHLDRLIGPWIESVGLDCFRVSPLAAHFGKDALDGDEQRRLHGAIAERLVERRTLSVENVNSILMHGLAGRSGESMAGLAWAVMSANVAVREALAEHVLLFRLKSALEPFYVEDPVVSVMLRMAQFKVAVVSDDVEWIEEVGEALLRESQGFADDELGFRVKVMAQMVVLTTMGIGAQFGGWVRTLVDFAGKVERREVTELFGTIDAGAAALRGRDILGGLFSIGATKLDTMAQLGRVLLELDNVDADTRRELLTPVWGAGVDYGVFINGPWLRCEEVGKEDWRRLEKGYENLATITRGWGIAELTMQCFAARAIVWDELGGDANGALEVLGGGVAVFGRHWILCRAIGRVHLRRGSFRDAFVVFREVADRLGGGNAVERVFALRDAAISAAGCGEWKTAEGWFGDAEAAARGGELKGFTAVAVGLRADAGIAALEDGRAKAALQHLAMAVEGLGGVGTKAGLKEAHCHLAVRHAVRVAAWRLTGREEVDGAGTVVIRAGMCSNPDPVEEVLRQPLPHIDLSWYLLAEGEVGSGVDVRVGTLLEERLTGGRIPIMEARLRVGRMEAVIEDGNAREFGPNLVPFCEGMAHLLRESARDGDVAASWASEPERGTIATWDSNSAAGEAERVAEHAIMSLGMVAAMLGRKAWLQELKGALAGAVGGVYPGKVLIDGLDGNRDLRSAWENEVVQTIRSVGSDTYIDPVSFAKAGLVFFEWSAKSAFGRVLRRRLSRWQADGWKKIMATERFRLMHPRYTVPRLTEVLAGEEDGQGFMARVLLSACEMVGLALGGEWKERLRQSAGEGEAGGAGR